MHVQSKGFAALAASIFRIVFLLVVSSESNGTATAAPWPLGEFSPQSSTTHGCPQGYSCRKFEVQCPRVSQKASGNLAVASPYAVPRGLIMFFSGGSGKSWWTAQSTEAYDLADDLRSLGFLIVQVKWSNSGWLRSSPGNDAGIAHLACRPATVIQYVHQQYYLPLGIQAPLGEAGFCITGGSGGASQVSYALSHYGLDQILDVVIPTGGPPHAALPKSCMNNPGEKDYWFSVNTRNFIDEGFGFFSKTGPCSRQDPSFISRWNEESTSTGGSDYYHPTTRVAFIVGEQDRAMRQIAKDYFRRLRQNGSPYVTWKTVSSTKHTIVETKKGRRVLRKSILAAIQ